MKSNCLIGFNDIVKKIFMLNIFLNLEKQNSPKFNRKNIIPLMLDNHLHFIAKLDFSSNSCKLLISNFFFELLIYINEFKA